MKENLNQDDIIKILLSNDQKQIQDIIDDIHPADILDIIHKDQKNIYLYLEHLPREIIADIIEEAKAEEQYDLLQLFVDSDQVEILEEMDNDEITDLIGELDQEEIEDIFEKISLEDQVEIKKLLTFDPESAGGIMSTEYIDIHANNTVQETLEFLQTNSEEDTTYYLYVVDKQNVLKGVVSLRDIVTSPFDTPMLEITNTNVKKLHYSVDQEEVSKKFIKYGFILMPVVDDEDHLLGVIHFDDVMEVIEEETTEDMNLLGGVHSEERVNSSLLESFRSRTPWLCVNLLTASMAASIVNHFEGTIEQVVALATITPIVAGLGGNAGTQSLTIMVRALSLGEVDKKNARSILIKEIGVGFLNGITIGTLAGIGAGLFAGNFYFGVVTGLAMFFSMILATIAGYFVPTILKRCNVDPALASGVFVTMCTDMLGFFFFLALATFFVDKLI